MVCFIIWGKSHQTLNELRVSAPAARPLLPLKKIHEKHQNDTFFTTAELKPHPKTLWHFSEFFHIFPRIERYFYVLFFKNRPFSIYAAENDSPLFSSGSAIASYRSLLWSSGPDLGRYSPHICSDRAVFPRLDYKSFIFELERRALSRCARAQCWCYRLSLENGAESALLIQIGKSRPQPACACREHGLEEPFWRWEIGILQKEIFFPPLSKRHEAILYFV